MGQSKYRDSRGKALDDYPQPSVAVDAALLTLDPELGLAVLEVYDEGNDQRDPGWALPGTFMKVDETLAYAVQRSLDEKAKVIGVRPRQLHVFDDIERDKRGRVLTVAHIAVVRAEQLASRAKSTRLMPAEAPGELNFDHEDIIKRAVEDIRARYQTQPDPEGLLDEPFTLHELQRVHEAVAGKPLMRDSFRRNMVKYDLNATGRYSEPTTKGRPAELFRIKRVNADSTAAHRHSPRTRPPHAKKRGV
jgi:ADP-ribose pyrophosphatase YjhB (NUDIX family)